MPAATSLGSRLRGFAHRHAERLDVVLAGVLAVLFLVSLATPPPYIDYDFRDPDAFSVAAAVLGAAAVAVRRRWPLPALAVAVVAPLVVMGLGYHLSAAGLPALLTLYTVSVVCSAAVSATAAVSTFAVVTVLLLTGPVEPTAADWVSNSLVIAVGWGLGRSVRSRRDYTVGLEERNRALVAAQESQMRTALVEERTRIAREMQDLVAHHLTAMTVQAAAAKRLVRRDPDTAEQVLGAVEVTGRSAMEEMRRVLGVLSTPAPDVRPAEPELRPQPGLDDLRELVEQERAAGLDVELECCGRPAQLDAGVALTAYRIVQEALANAREHAGPAQVRVAVACDDDGLHLRVEDDGRGATSRWRRAGGEGRGLSVLHERAALYGGTVAAGPRRGGGFSVLASLPTRPPPAGTPTSPARPTPAVPAPLQAREPA
jgi:signal transduction histidine kinase